MDKIMRFKEPRRAHPMVSDATPVKDLRRYHFFHVRFHRHRDVVSLSAVKSQLFQKKRFAKNGAESHALNALAPPFCPVTNEEIKTPHAASPTGWAALHFVEEPYCRRCGIPFAAEYGSAVECASCIATPPDFDRARAAVLYDDASHNLIVAFKHSDRTELAPMFAAWMTRAGNDLVNSASILAPAPLHWRRLVARRYNQSLLLAGAIAKTTGARLAVGDLIRIRATPPQKNLSRDARRRNVAGAFGIRKGAREMIKDAHITLIDDVLTTGATLSSAARTLKKAGARRVDALVLARVVKGGIGAI